MHECFVLVCLSAFACLVPMEVRGDGIGSPGNGVTISSLHVELRIESRSLLLTTEPSPAQLTTRTSGKLETFVSP